MVMHRLPVISANLCNPRHRYLDEVAFEVRRFWQLSLIYLTLACECYQEYESNIDGSKGLWVWSCTGCGHVHWPVSVIKSMKV